jgi:hypothetical protein
MSTDARTEFDAIGSALAAVAPVAASKMFGMPCLKVEGKAFAGLYGEAMVFKLDADSRPGALALPGAQLFDPMGGRPMKEWVEVPAAQAAHWDTLAQQALAYVGPAR